MLAVVRITGFEPLRAPTATQEAVDGQLTPLRATVAVFVWLVHVVPELFVKKITGCVPLTAPTAQQVVAEGQLMPFKATAVTVLAAHVEPPFEVETTEPAAPAAKQIKAVAQDTELRAEAVFDVWADHVTPPSEDARIAPAAPTAKQCDASGQLTDFS